MFLKQMFWGLSPSQNQQGSCFKLKLVIKRMFWWRTALLEFSATSC